MRNILCVPHGTILRLVFASVVLLAASVAWAQPPEARFAAMSAEQRQAYETEVREAYRSGDRSAETMRKIADLALFPPKLNTSPLPDYAYRTTRAPPGRAA